MNIGGYIKEKRLLKGMTQEELADKCEVTVRTIQRIENGEVDPRTYTLHAIAAALDIEYAELFHGDAPTPMMGDRSSRGSFWLAILHLSGVLLLVFPPLIIWSLNKDHVPDVRQHAVASINFQLSMVIYMHRRSIDSCAGWNPLAHIPGGLYFSRRHFEYRESIEQRTV